MTFAPYKEQRSGSAVRRRQASVSGDPLWARLGSFVRANVAAGEVL